MRITRFIIVPLIGVLLVLGACGSPAATPPPTTPPPTTPPPTTPPPTTPPPTNPPPTNPPPTTPPPTTPPPTNPPPTNPPPTNPTGPAVFVTSDLRITPLRIEPKEGAVVIVNVKNTGGQPGTYKVELKVNNVTYATKDVTLNGGASQDVTFGVTEEKEGKYAISVDKLSITVSWEVL